MLVIKIKIQINFENEKEKLSFFIYFLFTITIFFLLSVPVVISFAHYTFPHMKKSLPQLIRNNISYSMIWTTL